MDPTIERASEKHIDVTPEIKAQIADAMLMLEFAVESGFKDPENKLVPATVVTTIKETAAATGTQVPVGQWVAFEMAYYELSRLMCPITAESLRNTQENRGFWNASPALNFNKLLWFITIVFATVVTVNEWWLVRYGIAGDGEVDWQNDIAQILQVIAPPAYGGLGACVFLLRSAHRYIHERSFDLHRRPEYLNRIFLGAIAGGSIILFINQDVPSEAGALRLSGTALGFLAGYSTDLLFNSIERVINALLPKVGIETVRRAPPSPVPAVDMTLKELMERYEAAGDDATKALYKALIQQLYKVKVE